MVRKWQAILFFVTISLGKGTSYCKHYEKRIGKLFAEFIEKNFIEIFKSSCNPRGNMSVQDGDPSQNSKAIKTALDTMGPVQFTIPPNRPDLNPTGNAFNLVEVKLSCDAVKYPILQEGYAKFLERVEKTLLCYAIDPIANIIKSFQKEYY